MLGAQALDVGRDQCGRNRRRRKQHVPSVNITTEPVFGMNCVQRQCTAQFTSNSSSLFQSMGPPLRCYLGAQSHHRGPKFLTGHASPRFISFPFTFFSRKRTKDARTATKNS